MRPEDVQKLRSLTSFEALIVYLRDDLDWPIEVEDAEEITFEYAPEELGIDPKYAVKIEKIRQIRPLAENQPWGIFYIEFESKKLPVVVLRRILRSLVPRSRQRDPNRPIWQMSDLLFISAQGEQESRSISFAHFQQRDGRIPELRTFSWDSRETHFYYIKNLNLESLRWPEDEINTVGWSDKWQNAFTVEHRYTINKSQELARMMAYHAALIRDMVGEVFELETEDGPLHELFNSFKTILIHDLDIIDFSDMYAQTITYGLFSARATLSDETTHEENNFHIPTSNPFLRNIFQELIEREYVDLDELGINQLNDLLNKIDIEAILREFGRTRIDEDPVIHFYELFLSQYDPEKRLQRGVFYTPKAVVKYIVKSVDTILKEEYLLKDGLADTASWQDMKSKFPELKIPDSIMPDTPFVQIIDPAVGTGTFLVEVIDVIHRTLSVKWENSGLSESDRLQNWGDYVNKFLIPRLCGFEIMMAPYSIAHLKIGIKLSETGYSFKDNQRINIYLTNSLEKPKDWEQKDFIGIASLANEARAADTLKNQSGFTIIIGNPPYSKASQNLGNAFEYLINQFRYFDNKRIKEPGAILFERDINNDYIKFLGLCRHFLDNKNYGIACMITSNSFLDGKNFRGVRDALYKSFNDIRIINLHGDSRSNELHRKGITDKNLFEIETGVSISVMVKFEIVNKNEKIQYCDIIGTRLQKEKLLTEDSKELIFEDTEIDLRRYYSFIPTKSSVTDEYQSFKRLDKIHLVGVDGIKTSRDGLVIANSFDECNNKIKQFRDFNGSPSDVEKVFRISVKKWDYKKAQNYLHDEYDESLIKQIAYRPFDFRYIYYDKELVFSDRHTKMKHMILGDNIGLVCASRLSSIGFDHVLPCANLVEMKYASHDTNSRLFPAYTYERLFSEIEKTSNISAEFLNLLPTTGDLSDNEKTEMAQYYIYSVLQSAGYRERYYYDIKNDFPCIPVTSNTSLFSGLSKLGEQLLNIHQLNISFPYDQFPFIGERTGVLIPPSLSGTKLYITNDSYFDNVSGEIYDFHMAGYQICRTWFTAGNRSGIQRKGNNISESIIDGFNSVLNGIEKSIAVRKEIDDLITSNGGWPLQ